MTDPTENDPNGVYDRLTRLEHLVTKALDQNSSDNRRLSALEQAVADMKVGILNEMNVIHDRLSPPVQKVAATLADNYVCDVCRAVFRTSDRLFRHAAAVHVLDTPTPMDIEVLKVTGAPHPDDTAQPPSTDLTHPGHMTVIVEVSDGTVFTLAQYREWMGIQDSIEGMVQEQFRTWRENITQELEGQIAHVIHNREARHHPAKVSNAKRIRDERIKRGVWSYKVQE